MSVFVIIPRLVVADAVWAAMVAGGAEEVYPLADQFYGRREGRLRDPFGHLWIVGQLRDAEPEE